MLALVALGGCASLAPRLPPPSAEEVASQEVSWGIRTLGPDGQFEVLRSNVVAERLRAQLRDRPLRILALSSGGANGAFGAGLIVGWTRSQARPDFPVVTGVSAGALIAPLAFLGSAWDPQIAEVYTTGVSQGVLRRRFFSGLFGSSVYSSARLKSLIEHYADDAMLAAVANEASKGRLLLVATTDLATGQPVIWDLTSIAMHGGREAKPLFRSVLLASASVPGMLPPVTINVRCDGVVHSETHVDGGLTVPFFLAPASADLPIATGDGMPAMVRVIINGSLSDVPSVTQAYALSIFRRSVSAAMTWMTKSTLERALAVSRAQGIDFQYAAIPASYPLRGSFDFDAATQRSLFEYAATCAQRAVYGAARRRWAPAKRFT
jgi:predicted acylesterase/phospholipase RssA